MNGEDRREKIINILRSSSTPVAGVALAKELNVSRQVIVQDVALLRANGTAIFSTNRGYVLQEMYVSVYLRYSMRMTRLKMSFPS